MPFWDDLIRAVAYLSRSNNHPLKASLILILKTDHIITQFNAVLDDNFETTGPFHKGIELERWKLISTHKRKYYLNYNKECIDRTKIWTDSELEKSVLLELPKSNDLNVNDEISSAENALSSPP